MNKSKSKKSWIKNKVVLLIIAIIVTMSLAAVYVFFIEPSISYNTAKDQLNKKITNEKVVGYNDEALSYTPESDKNILEGSNPKQLALGKNGQITPPAYFEFRSKNTTDNSHIVDLYLDFFSQRGRDLISLNQQTLESYIGTGKIILRVHPVLGKEGGFSLFAPEALSEVFCTHPDLAWNFFVSLMKNSDTVLNNIDSNETQQETNKKIVDFISEILQKTNVPSGSPNGVDSDSLKYLSFFSWLYTGGEDEKLKVGYYPPVLYIDDKEIDQDKWVLTDPESFAELIGSIK